MTTTQETMSASQMATVYGLKSSQAFNKLMEKCGVLTHNDKGYFLVNSLMGCGYVTVVEVGYFLPNGIRATKKKAVWTEAGQTFVRQTLAHHGIWPASECKGLFDN